MAVCVYRAFLLISVDKEKVDRLTPDERMKPAQAMATTLRKMPGVRQTEAVVFREWREGGQPAAPVWEPVGAFVAVEAPTPDSLQRKIDAIWKEAGTIDQRGCELNGVDDW